MYIHKEQGWGQDRTICIKEMRTFPPSFPVHRNTPKLGTARRRECKFENVAKKATPRRLERTRVQKRPRLAGESANAPRAGESEIQPILGTMRRQEHIFENGIKIGTTRRRELHL